LDSVARSDVVATVFGASTALAGLTLVFLGVVIGRYEEALPGASRRVRGRFVGPTAWLFTAFLFGLANAGTSFLWLVVEGGRRWYVVVVVLFFVQLVATALAAGYVALGILRKM
jgi:hypothetical protein